MSRASPLLFALLVALLVACAGSNADTFEAGGYHYEEAPTVEWKLPKVLHELSGFATDAENRLFGHNDEVAIVHEIDYLKGTIVKSFALGNPPVPGDFEGITLIDGRFALTTSDGTLYLAAQGYLAPEVANGANVEYQLVKTGLGRRCEIEGVEYVPSDRLFYFACKSARDPQLRGHITLIAWSLERRAEVPEHTISIPLTHLSELPGDGAIQPSGIARAPTSGAFVLTAARRRALITLSPEGELLSAVTLPQPGSMKQIEAVAVGTDGTLMLGSEGKPKNGGRMRVYRVAN